MKRSTTLAELVARVPRDASARSPSALRELAAR